MKVMDMLKKKYPVFGRQVSLWVIIVIIVLLLLAFATYYLCPKGKLDGTAFEFLCRKKVLKPVEKFIVSPAPPLMP
jgi:hypothetical protein